MIATGRTLQQFLVFAALLLASLTAIALAVGVSVGIGDLPIPLSTTFKTITNRIGLTTVALNRMHETVIWDYRLSRALVAAFCGAGLALCGAIMQSLLRNPLAEPYVLGISAGASTGAVAIVILGIGSGAVSLSAGAFAGAFAAFLFVALLSNGTRGGADRTILAGVAASQLFNAATSYIVTTSGNAQQARDVMFWLLGSFGGVRWPEFMLVSVVVGLGLAACLCYARVLDAFAFGDEAAAALGVEILRQWHRHAADAAADVEDALMRLQSADANEMPEEFGADRAKVAVADEDRIRRRVRHEAVRLQRGHEPVELGPGRILHRNRLRCDVSEGRHCRHAAVALLKVKRGTSSGALGAGSGRAASAAEVAKASIRASICASQRRVCSQALCCEAAPRV